MSDEEQWIVVGGGVSGIAAAFFLRQHNIAAEIVEKDGALGGRMGASQIGERWIDLGGKNVGKRYKLFREFVASLGPHEFEDFGLNSSQVFDGKIVTFDASRRLRSLFSLTRDARFRDVWRLAHLLCKIRSNESYGYLGSKLSASIGRVRDAAPVSAYFSAEFCRRLIRPMSVRMNGAEPDEIYAGNLGSNLLMIMDSFDQLRDGVTPVLNDFMSAYNVRLNSRVDRLLFRDGRVNGVRITNENGASRDLTGCGVILATPAWISAELLAPLDLAIAGLLRRISYYPVSLILAEYNRPIFSPQVRALVLDEDELLSNAGAYSVRDMHLVRYTFSGRSARPHMNDRAEELLEAGEKVLNRYIPVNKSERKRFHARHFDPGLCAYAPFHSDLLDNLKARLSNIPGLQLTGDYVQGASLEACFRAAKKCVEGIQASYTHNEFLTSAVA